jgi:hypothetical protein
MSGERTVEKESKTLLKNFVALLLILGCLWASQWQFQRGLDRQDRNAMIESQLQKPALDIGVIRENFTSYEWRSLSAIGTFDPTNRRFGPAIDRLKHQEQQREQDDHAPDRMQQHGIEPACPLAASGFADDDRACDVAGALILCADGCGDRLYRRTGVMERFLQLHHHYHHHQQQLLNLLLLLLHQMHCLMLVL